MVMITNISIILAIITRHIYSTSCMFFCLSALLFLFFLLLLLTAFLAYSCTALARWWQTAATAVVAAADLIVCMADGVPTIFLSHRLSFLISLGMFMCAGLQRYTVTQQSTYLFVR